MKKLLTICAIVAIVLAANNVTLADLVLVSVNTSGRPDLTGTITTYGTSVNFDITAVGQADDGNAVNTSKYYSQTNFDNEYFTISAAGKFLKYNMFSGNTTPAWGTSWGDATAPLPEGVTFSQTQDGDDFVYAVTMSYSALEISVGDTFSVQIKARDFNDDYVQSYMGFDGFDGEYSQYRGLWITDTGQFDVTIPATYSCFGFYPPVHDEAVKVKKNRVIPFKAELLDEDGYLVIDTDIAAPPVIQVLFQAIEEDAVDVTDDAYPAGLGTDGNQFEFSGGKWQFNLKTKDHNAPGTYTVTMVSGDTDEYVIESTCEATFVIE